jgi:hypothetical protein
MLTPCPIIFSGHNDRAVVALCRYFHAQRLPFRLVAKHKGDVIYQTTWRDYVLFQREEPSLAMPLMERISMALKTIGLSPVLCPTSEFLNGFVLDNRARLIEIGWNCALPEPDLYRSISDKGRSAAIVCALSALIPPATKPRGEWSTPCVLKPKRNVVNGKMMYPLLCETPDELEAALVGLEFENWFCQQWVDGQSLYLCAYLDRAGDFNAYWQENLLQQSPGKSIVLARTTTNPGIDVQGIMTGLHNMSYFGPFMMEIIRDDSGRFFFIEVNPRFWGPLNLSLRACPNLLNRFAVDQLGASLHHAPCADGEEHWYAWSFGASSCRYRRFCAALPYDDANLATLLRDFDVYAAPDTQALSGRH